jgi:hypothetical protein
MENDDGATPASAVLSSAFNDSMRGGTVALSLGPVDEHSGVSILSTLCSIVLPRRFEFLGAIQDRCQSNIGSI